MPQSSASAAPSNTVKSAMRTLDIIEFVVAHPQGPIAQDIAAALDIPVSSLSYLLSTLAEREYLVRDGRRYRPGPGLHRLIVPRASLTLAERVEPLVKVLRSELDETASFMVRTGWEVEALVTEASGQALRYAIEPGHRKPLHALAERYFAETERAKLTPQTRTTEAELRADFAQIMATGFSLAREEATVGICGMAVPVWIGEQLAGAFSVAVPAVRFDVQLAERVRQLLLRLAGAVK